MKTTSTYTAGYSERRRRTKAAVCLNSCRTLYLRLQELKNRLLHEFGGKLRAYDQLLRSAVNEAEALAWQTPYPHLLFPVLAQEKAAAVENWARRQQKIRQATLRLAA
jgi:hypothetical protein